MSYQLVTPPALEPITLTDAKAFLRVDSGDTSQDSYILALITAARIHVENETQRSLATTEWLMQLDHFPLPTNRQLYGILELPRPPFQSITFFKYVDQSGTPQTLAPTDYTIDTGQTFARIYPAYLKFWPTTRWYPASVQIQWKSGYGLVEPIPQPLLQACFLLIGHWFEHREAVDISNSQVREVPLGFAELISTYRDLRF